MFTMLSFKRKIFIHLLEVGTELIMYTKITYL